MSAWGSVVAKLVLTSASSRHQALQRETLHLGERQVIQHTRSMAMVPWRRGQNTCFLKGFEKKTFCFFLGGLLMGDLKIGSLVLSLSLISLFAKEDHSHPASTTVSGQEVGCCGYCWRRNETHWERRKKQCYSLFQWSIENNWFYFLLSLSGVPCMQWWEWKLVHLMFPTELFLIYSDVLLFFAYWIWRYLISMLFCC